MTEPTLVSAAGRHASTLDAHPANQHTLTWGGQAASDQYEKIFLFVPAWQFVSVATPAARRDERYLFFVRKSLVVIFVDKCRRNIVQRPKRG